MLREALYQPRQAYQRPSPQEVEAILALFLVTDNLHEVERLTGWSRDVVRRVVRDADEVGVLHERRIERRQEYVDLASDVIMQALLTVQDGLRKGYLKGRKLDADTGQEVHLVSKVRPGEAAGVVHKLYQVVRLHEAQKPDIIQQIVQSMSTQEIMDEAERTRAQILQRMGRLL